MPVSITGQKRTPFGTYLAKCTQMGLGIIYDALSKQGVKIRQTVSDPFAHRLQAVHGNLCEKDTGYTVYIAVRR